MVKTAAEFWPGRLFFEGLQDDRQALAEMSQAERARYCGQGDRHPRRSEQ